jgi:hypothetical protein
MAKPLNYIGNNEEDEQTKECVQALPDRSTPVTPTVFNKNSSVAVIDLAVSLKHNRETTHKIRLTDESIPNLVTPHLLSGTWQHIHDNQCPKKIRADDKG